MSKSMRNSWKDMEGHLPFWEFAIIEWKYWQVIPVTPTPPKEVVEVAKEIPKPVRKPVKGETPWASIINETPKPAKAENKPTNMINAGKTEAIGKSTDRSNKYNPRYDFYFRAGDIGAVGSAQKIQRFIGTKSTQHLCFTISISNRKSDIVYEYIILPSDINMEIINNPGIYQYKTDPIPMLHGMQMDQIIILKTPDDKYLAIRPIEMRQEENEPVTLVYEWKYWPTAPTVPTVPNQTVANVGQK